MIVMRVLTILMFLNKSPTTNEKELMWQTGIVLSHTLYLVCLIVIGAISYKIRKEGKPGPLASAVQYAMILIILLFSTLLVVIDQLITTSITPFLIACIAVGIIFIIKPCHSLIIFLSSYILYYFTLAITQPDLSILLSNRVNGLTSVAFGILLSFILWRTNVINLQQKERIDCQQAQLAEKNAELEKLATIDFLTGLINRRCFEERISLEISRMKRYGGQSCLLMLDIDNFKSINDKFGHPAGDAVLEGFSSLLKNELRETDIIARVGGEEFAIILVNADDKTGENVANKIRNSVETKVFNIENREIRITVSIGLTLLDSSLNSYEEAYKYADRALYAAKAQGKNRVEVSGQI